MDRKLKTGQQWYASPDVINLREFLETAWESDLLLRNALRRPAADIVFKEEDYHAAQLSKDFSQLTGCNSATARTIFEKDLALSNFVADPDIPARRRWVDDLCEESNMRPNVLRTHVYAQTNLNICQQPQKKSNYLRSMKYDKFEQHEHGLERQIPEWSQTSAKDIVIMVTVIVPYNRILPSDELRTSRLLTAQNKFLLRGESTLYSLRKKLACVCDFVVPLTPGHELEAPDMELSHMVQYPSSFIFVNDTFYVDYSMDGSTDISAPIREFMGRKPGFDPVKSQDMAGVRIVDLNLRLGQPYVFQHSGTCEHLLVFHDLRLLHKSDPQELDKYPVLCYEKGGDAKCAACKVNFATYRVEDCDRLPASSMLFCDDCFRDFHFSHDVKIGKFTAYPHFQVNRLAFS